jgi:hypothetical protein
LIDTDCVFAETWLAYYWHSSIIADTLHLLCEITK